MVQTINDPSKKKNMEFRYNPKVRSFLGFSHNPIRFQITFGHEKSPYPKYIYIISISYIIILQKKNWIMFPWIIEKLLLQWACIWRFPKSWGYPEIITSSMFSLGFSDVPWFFSKKTAILGYPKKRWKLAMASSPLSKVQGIAHQEDLRDQTIPRQLQLASASLKFLFKDTKFKASILGEYLLYVCIYIHTCIIEIVYYITYITK